MDDHRWISRNHLFGNMVVHFFPSTETLIDQFEPMEFSVKNYRKSNYFHSSKWKKDKEILIIMKVRFLGHSCIEIIGYRHILIDPDFAIEPESGVEYICVTHGHQDHIGRIAEIPTGLVIASPDVCQMAIQMGVSHHRLRPVQPG